MSSIISGIITGAVYGFQMGGPWGAFAGAVVGGVLGAVIENSLPDANIGAPPLQESNITTSEEGLIIYDFLGTTKLAGNFMHLVNEIAVEELQEVESGKGGGGSETVVTGYRYYMSWVVGIAIGPVNNLFTIYNGPDVVWIGNVDYDDYSGDPATITIEGMGSVTFYFGTSTQTANSAIATYLDDSTLNPSYRNMCYAFFNNCYIGNNNRCPVMSFVVKKIPDLVSILYPELGITYSQYFNTGHYDYNPVFAIHYILTEMVGLDKSFINTFNFAAVALELSDSGEEFGLGILFSESRSARDYITEILRHIDGVLDYRYSDSDGKYGLSLQIIRADVDEGDIPEILQDNMRDKPLIERDTFVGVVNEIKVRHPLRLNRLKTFEPKSIWDDGNGENYDTFTPRPTMGMLRGHLGERLFSYAFIRFPDITLAKGQLIKKAWITFTCRESYNESYPDFPIYTTNVYFENSGDAVAPTSYIESQGLSKTTPLSWSVSEPWYYKEEYDTIDLSSILQEVINRDDWAYGNAVMFLNPATDLPIFYDAGNPEENLLVGRLIYAYTEDEQDNIYCPKLNVVI